MDTRSPPSAPARYWVLGDGQGYAGKVLRNGMHLVEADIGRTYVRVRPVGASRFRRITRRAWDTLPSVCDWGQSFSEVVAELRHVAETLPRTTRPIRARARTTA